MRFYDCKTAPSPRRVRIFIAEKGLAIPTVEVDLRGGEHLTPEFRRLNPWMTVPVLELGDGTTISEAVACCRYLEECHPEPTLMGRTPQQKAEIAMWDHRCELDGFFAAAEAFRNATPGMKGRALPGPDDYEQIPALAERGRMRVGRFFAWLNARLADAPYVGGSDFSIADITALCAVDFAAWAKIRLPDECGHVAHWLETVRQRPSVGG